MGPGSWLALALALSPVRAARGADRPLSIPEALAEVRASRFPGLAGARIELATMECDGCFFSASVAPLTAWKAPLERTYVLSMDPDFLEAPPSTAAVAAVLAHELAHIEDYARMSTTRLVVLGLRYLMSPSFRARYERETDAAAVGMGFGPGLREFRLWQKERLTPAQFKRVERDYLSPEEIEGR